MAHFPRRVGQCPRGNAYSSIVWMNGRGLAPRRRDTGLAASTSTSSASSIGLDLEPALAGHRHAVRGSASSPFTRTRALGH
jgi:hypothetical protein